ncbi:MAG: hypothetical protein NTV79_08565 [Candidatus Aureabacteria bacterium]|nr:hypothetical protein [Candidatus Auribacterota bacterium]
MSDGRVEVVVTAEVGPRIIRFGFVGQANEFCEIPSQNGRTGGKGWRLYGGHRLWRAPEDKKLTYLPDNRPVAWRRIGNGLKVIQTVEAGTGLRKEMEIAFTPRSGRVSVLHRISNRGRNAAVLSLWAITALAPGGIEIVPIEIIPQEEKDTGLLPNRALALWPYTRLDDPRVRWEDKHIVIRQDPRIARPFKIGVSGGPGWAAYFNRGRLFVKTYRPVPNAPYPDFGASYETYANDVMLEMETLSPLARLLPGESAEHQEEWSLFDGVPFPGDDQKSLEKVLNPLVAGLSPSIPGK